MKRSDFEFILKLLKENAGWNFDEDKYFVLDKKISNFIREKDLASAEDLFAMLRAENKPLIAQIVESMALANTSFFRNVEVFDKFKNIVLPKLKEKCRATKKLNIWSLGCSSGQEAYSIAIIIKQMKNMFSDWEVNISASDLSSVAISKAQRGIYNNFEVQTGLNIREILDFFSYNEDYWQINDDIKKMVEFRKYNLLDEAISKSKFEVVFCRNVLRYFSREYQDKILERISKKQPRGGYLYLGKGEVVPAIEKYYYPLDTKTGAYLAIGEQVIENSVDVNLSGGKALPSFRKPDNLV